MHIGFKILIAMIAVITLILIIAVALLIANNKPSADIPTAPVVHTDFSNWMSALSLDTAIGDIILPGSHNAGSSYLNKNHPVDAQIKDSDRAVFRAARALAPHIVANYSICQTLSLADQFAAGVRYFDLRLAPRQPTESITTPAFRFTHGLVGEDATPPILELIRAVMAQSREIVVLNIRLMMDPNVSYDEDQMNKDYRVLTHAMYNSYVVNTRSDNLFTSRTTLREFLHKKTKFIVLKEIRSNPDYPKELISTAYPETTDLNKIMKFIDDESKVESDTALRVSSVVATAHASHIIGNLGGSILTNAKEVNLALMKKISQGELPKENLNIISVDAVDTPGLMPVIISMNVPKE